MTVLTVIIATTRLHDLQQMQAVLAEDPGLRVLAHCPGLTETFHAVECNPPDIVLISQHLTLGPEFEVMRALFEVFAVRWLVMERSSDMPRGTSHETPIAFNPKSDLFSIGLDQPRAAILTQIRTVTYRARNSAAPPIRPAAMPERPQTRAMVNPAMAQNLVLIGASTGGIDALVSILEHFTADAPPTVIVQHTSQAFGTRLVQLLALRCRAQVVACEDGLELGPGMVCVAAGMPGHAIFSGFGPLRLAVRPGEPVAGHMPSIDRLFMSAVPVARRVTAAVLTGMGQDGAAGLLALRQAGAATFAQDAATSVVYGMPRVAFENGGAERQLPLDRIAGALLHKTRVGA